MIRFQPSDWWELFIIAVIFHTTIATCLGQGTGGRGTEDIKLNVVHDGINRFRTELEQLSQNDFPKKTSDTRDLSEQIRRLKSNNDASSAKLQKTENVRQQGFNIPELKSTELGADIIIVCENNRAFLSSFVSVNKALASRTEISNDQRIGLEFGDFDIKVTTTESGMFILSLTRKSGAVGEDSESIVPAESQLKQLLATRNPNETIVQFAVYPDSFEVFRNVRSTIGDFKYKYNWEPMNSNQEIPLGGGAGLSTQGGGG